MKVRHKVLIVDDELPIRRLIRAALERADYAIIEAANAREATERLREERPDIVLLDLGLPDRDGLEMIPLIKSRSDATLMVVSAREDVAEKVAALDLGADDYLTKPFDTEELLARIRTALRHRLAGDAENDQVVLGEVNIDLGHRRVRRGDDEFTSRARNTRCSQSWRSIPTASSATPSSCARCGVRHANRASTTFGSWYAIYARSWKQTPRVRA